MADYDLLDKTELRLEPVTLENANLNHIAKAIAGVLGLKSNDVMVTDVRGETLTIDILKRGVDAHNIIGKRSELLNKLSELPGVGISDNTSICSEGMLGWIVLDYNEVGPALERSEQMAREIRRRIAKRAIVFSTGIEVYNRQIEDTNSPLIKKGLEAEGYSVTVGSTLKDDELLIAGNLRQAIDNGYGLIITTGGVGAEDKDHTIEAVLALDPEAAAPYVCKFRKGTGRHHKDGVKIAVGYASEALIIALTGPNDEVKSSLDILINGLKSNLGKEILAQELARNLSKMLQEKMGAHGHQGHVI
ncbi:MAG: competence/damage-inducible protein A [Deltaproteobacteria bacterium]|nr:competence/damage-inducible protein A [Deltaproteobacteria bacterium]